MGAAVEGIFKQPEQLLARVAEAREFLREGIGHVAHCIGLRW